MERSLTGPLRALEYGLIIAGCCGLTMTARAVLRETVAKHAATAVVERHTQQPAVTSRSRPGSVIGELQLPAAHLRTPVLEGCTDTTLGQGSCRITGTAAPGGLGTVGIAGHRDTSFRALRGVNSGDEVLLKVPAGTYHYRVDRTRIVSPQEVSVLNTGDEPLLVLVTCYPFHFVGSAPQRYIVEAHLLSAVPSE